jgi:monoamine oxidase
VAQGGDRDKDRLSRRRFIGAAGATAAGAALGGYLPQGALGAPAEEAKAGKPKNRRRRRRADVIVVGAGLAGLTAAREVLRGGHSVLILEARNRVGGRTLNHKIGGGKVAEVGGEWVGPTQDHLMALAAELGIGTYKTYNDGNNVYWANGLLTPYKSGGPLGPIPPDPTAVAEVFLAVNNLNQMAGTVPVATPWSAPDAGTWDGQTLETWKQANLHVPNARALFDTGIGAVFAAESSDLSLLFALFYIASATNETTAPDLNRLFNVPDGAQDSRFIGGSQLISKRMAKRIGRKRILLKQAVRRIEQHRRGVRVFTQNLTASGKRVIVTGPPVVTAQIHYDPHLPADRRQLLQRFPQGTTIKCQAVYDRPYWRDSGLTGQAVALDGPVRVTFDNSPPDGSPGVLLGFIEGAAARDYQRRSAGERKAAVLNAFATYFGEAARHPREYFEMNWTHEAWTRGCYEGYLGPGALTAHGTALRAPFKRIHWAGAETSDYWYGYMDGAVRSGERAAAEALAAL